MAVQTSYPGVYIDEFAPGAPIQGVGTSTAAFIGPAQRGPIDEPTRVTSWDQFKDAFGEQPLQGFYMWQAVRGFFQNGGTVCYIVRASNGNYDTLTLDNGVQPTADPTWSVRSQNPPQSGSTIDVTLTRRSLISQASVYQPAPVGITAAVSLQELQLSSQADAAQFRPGDDITLVGGTARARVARVTQDTVFLSAPLTGAAGGGSVRLADLTAGQRTVRIAPPTPPATIPTIQNRNGQSVSALNRGTILTLMQGTVDDTLVVESVQTENFTGPAGATTTFRVTFREGLHTPFAMSGAAIDVDSQEFDFEVDDGVAETFRDLGFDSEHPRYYADILNADPDVPVRIDPIEPPPSASLGESLPVAMGPTPLSGGNDEDLTTLSDQNMIDALDTLEAVDAVNLIAAPDAGAGVAALNRDPIQQAMIAHCERMADRFAILDSGFDRTVSGTNSVEGQRNALDSSRGYAALYFPWLRVPPPRSGPPVLVPPSGHICGIIARSDASRGVHKAPANEIINGALGLQQNLSDVEQGILNLQGINVLRVFAQGGRPVVWGARTTATDTNWQYVSTRRLFLYLEESIEKGINWAIFEPNNLDLWQKLKRTIRDFLMTEYRKGALFGDTPDKAFYVRIDETLNPFSERQLGRLHLEIGVQPAYPAEFIVVRIGIWDGGSEVSEA